MANQVSTLKMEQKFKKTALGLIPIDWKLEPLSSVAKIIMGQSPDSASCNSSGDGIPFYQGNADFGEISPTPRAWCTAPTKRAAAGDILVSVRAPVGEINIAPHACCIGRGLTAVRAVDIDAQYLYYGMNLLAPIMTQLSQGSTFKAINCGDLANLPFAVPPLVEQKRITEILSMLDDAVDRSVSVLGKARALKARLIQQLTYQGVGHTKFTDTELGRLPKGWQVVTLEKIADIQRGKFQYRPRNEPRFYGGKYPFIQTGEVTASGGRIRHYTQTLNEEGLAISRLFPKGTILITIAANIGETAIAEFDVAFPDSLVGIMANEGVDNRFLEYYLRTRKKHLNGLAPASAQKNINLETLRPYPVPLPPWDEQVIIADALDTAYRQEESEQAVLANFNILKSALMDQLLTGKVRAKPHEP